MAWVYILKCRDGSYYTGFAEDLARRLVEHNEGTYSGYTAARLPVTLVFCQETANPHEAFCLEQQIKGWSRNKKEALIAGRYDLLPELSRSRTATGEAGAS
jgi:putative endonuclease